MYNYANIRKDFMSTSSVNQRRLFVACIYLYDTTCKNEIVTYVGLYSDMAVE